MTIREQANTPAIPTGMSCAVHQASDGSVDLYSGDELRTTLEETLEANCAIEDDMCESSIQADLLAADYDLQSRAIGFLLFAGGISLAVHAP